MIKIKLTISNDEINKLFPIDPIDGYMGKKIQIAKRNGAREILEELKIKLV